MAEVIRMPRMSDTMEEGNIVEWLKKVGDTVEAGDVLAEVETDKATMELESYQDGVLLHIGVESGPVPVDGVLAVIGEKGEDFKELLEAALKENIDANSNAEGATETQTEKVEEITVSSDKEPMKHSVSTNGDGRVKASPLAKSMAKEANVDLGLIVGTGENQRIVKKDVEAFIANKPTVSETISVPAIDNGLADFEYGEQAISQMRKTIARRLAESKFGAPHFYLTVEIDMSGTMAIRKEINENAETRISFNDFVVKACAMALRKHPAINSSWNGNSISYHKQINVGVAVAVNDGLLVPVINNTDYKTLSQINKEVKELAVKAKDKKLQLPEMQGNTFTVSNLGMFDIEEFTAIINPPDSCILAVGSIREKPIVKNGQIVPGNLMKVTLSCDHRIVDGVTGAKFLQTVKEYLEQPVRMLV